MEPIWLTQYPRGIPAEVDVHQFESLRAVLQRSCGRFEQLPAYTNMGTSISYAELDRASRDSQPSCSSRSSCARATAWRS